MAQPFLSIIIPAYNEAERLPKTLVDVDYRLTKADYSYEIIVVSDGSKDATADIVHKMIPAIRSLKLIDHPQNRGKGTAVREGMLAAKGKIRLFMDADNATTIDQFGSMLPFFSAGGGSAYGGKESYDIVIGSRAHEESVLKPAEPWYRQLPGKLGNLFIQLLLLPGIWDTQCGFKAFTEESAERIFSKARIDRWGFDVEVLALGKQFGYRIKEVPVVWTNEVGSHVGFSTYLQVLLETVTIRWWLWTNSYDRPSITNQSMHE